MLDKRVILETHYKQHFEHGSVGFLCELYLIYYYLTKLLLFCFKTSETRSKLGLTNPRVHPGLKL